MTGPQGELGARGSSGKPGTMGFQGEQGIPGIPGKTGVPVREYVSLKKIIKQLTYYIMQNIDIGLDSENTLVG